MIENDVGQVALRHITPQQKLITAPSGNQYVFIPRAHIALAWVEKSDVDPLLGIRQGCGCNNGSKKQVIIEADETAVRRWTNGGGR